MNAVSTIERETVAVTAGAAQPTATNPDLENNAGTRRAGAEMLRGAIMAACGYRDEGARDPKQAAPVAVCLADMAADEAYEFSLNIESMDDSARLTALDRIGSLLKGAAYSLDCSPARCRLLEEAVTMVHLLVSELLKLRSRPEPFSISATKPWTPNPAPGRATNTKLSAEDPVKQFGEDIYGMLMGSCASSILTMLEQMDETLQGSFTDEDVEERFYVCHARALQMANYLYSFHNDSDGPTLEEVAKATRFKTARLLADQAELEAA